MLKPREIYTIILYTLIYIIISKLVNHIMLRGGFVSANIMSSTMGYAYICSANFAVGVVIS